MVLTTLSFGILSTCPNQLKLLLLICLIIFIFNYIFQFLICFKSPLSICLLCWAKYPSHYPPFEYHNFCLIFSFKTQHSDPYTTTDLIKTLYKFILNFLNISLLWNIFLFAKKARLPDAILSFISSSIRLSLVTILPRYLTLFTS